MLIVSKVIASQSCCIYRVQDALVSRLIGAEYHVWICLDNGASKTLFDSEKKSSICCIFFFFFLSKIYVSKDDSQKTMRGVHSHSKNSTGTSLLPKVSGLINHGNNWYINSMMQCLNCITPLVAYFLGDAYLVDVNPSSSYDGTVAGRWELLLVLW